jgi:hypothetical protein
MSGLLKRTFADGGKGIRARFFDDESTVDGKMSMILEDSENELDDDEKVPELLEEEEDDDTENTWGFTQDYSNPYFSPKEPAQEIPASPSSPKSSVSLLFGRNLGEHKRRQEEKWRKDKEASEDAKLSAWDKLLLEHIEKDPDFHGWDYEDWELSKTGNDGFDLHSRNVGLTYSQVGGWEKEDIIAGLQEIFEGETEEILVAEEYHKDGQRHFHVLLRFHKKKRFRNSKAFDVGPLHPNIKNLKDKKGVTRWTQYVTKEGGFLTTRQMDMSTPANYIKRKADFQMWKADAAKKATRPEKWESLSLFGHTFKLSEKKRSLWIFGASDAGKTTTVKEGTKGITVFLRKGNQYMYEGYAGESIIISDDQHDKGHPLSQAEICHMLGGTWNDQPTSVYGATRFYNYFLKNGVNIHYIVITNAAPDFIKESWFTNRFHILEVVDAQWKLGGWASQWKEQDLARPNDQEDEIIAWKTHIHGPRRAEEILEDAEDLVTID